MRAEKYVQYYDMHGELNHGFLHPGRRQATDQILSFLQPLTAQSTVVEIGCGTGETANLILERFPCPYIGIDASAKMLERAKARVFGHGNRAAFILRDVRIEGLRLPSGSVDALIAESVFAILDPQKIFSECWSALKQGGILAWNDRIWGDAVSDEDRSRINHMSRKMFGCCAAPSDLPLADDWKSLVERSGFKMIASRRIAEIQKPGAEKSGKKLLILGHLLAHPKYFRFRCFDWIIERRFKRMWAKMENWIFVARKD